MYFEVNTWWIGILKLKSSRKSPKVDKANGHFELVTERMKDREKSEKK